MGLKVLIVDDSAVMRKIIEKTIRQSGLEISETLHAGSGREGLDVLRSTGDVGLILCDYHMPEMDGLTMVRAVRTMARYMATPIIMVTTEAGEERIQEARAAGADGYLSKPFPSEKLKEVVDQLRRGYEVGAPQKKSGRIIDAVIEGVQESLQALLGINTERVSAFLSSEPKPFDGISAVVGLAGRTTISVHCSEETAMYLTSRMLGVDVKTMGPEVQDAIGEITNVVSGVVKRKAGQNEKALEISTPEVIVGKGHSVEPYVRWPNMGVDFRFPGGQILVILSLASAVPAA